MKKFLSACCALLLLGLSVSNPLASLAASPKSAVPTYTAALEDTAPAASVTFAASSGSSKTLQSGDSLAGQFVLTADADALWIELSGKGTATISLFAFATDANISMMVEPLAETTVTVSRKSYAVFRFADGSPLAAGEYVLAVHDATGVAVSTTGAHASQLAYLNGKQASDTSLRISASYTKTPSTLYGKPTPPTATDFNEYAPHMASALRLDTKSGAACVGGGNAMTATFMTENGESFTRFQPSTNASDPYLWLTLPSDTAKTEEYGYLLMKVRLDEGAPYVSKGQIYFITDECTITEPASVRFNYEESADWQYIILNFSSNSYYKGMLQQLRFDPFPEVEGTHYVDVAYMALFRTQDGAEAFRDNFSDFEEDTTVPDQQKPDYSTYETADTAGTPESGKLTANGKLNYIYKETTCRMDFSEPAETYHAGSDFGFTGLSDAMVVDGQLHCRPWGETSFYTRRMVGDEYGLRGGELSFDLSLTYGSLTVILRQMLENDEQKYSGLVFTLTPDGTVTARERDGFAVTAQIDADLSLQHRITFRDTTDRLELSCDDRVVLSIAWDSYTQTLTAGDVTASASHLPGAGYATVSLSAMRGYLDQVSYTHTDIRPNTNQPTTSVDYSTWVAVDDLGRVTPTDEAGQGEDRVVGLFYFMFHSYFGGRSVNDVTRMYLNDGLDALKNTLSSFAGRDGAYWAEPYFGYYSSNDEWVFRKHAYMLDAAGVDFIFLDLSNNVFYEEQVQLLFDTWLDIRKNGGSTPQIALMFGDMPFTFVNGVYTFRELLSDPTYAELWFKWEGKTLILGNNDGTLATKSGRYPTWTVSGSTPQSQEQYKAYLEQNPQVGAFVNSKEINSFLEDYTVRKSWAWQNSDSKSGRGYWDWLQDSPQNPGHDFDGNVEQMPVIMGTHAHSNRGRSLVGGDATYDRAGDFGFTLGTAKYGYQFAESFEYALNQNVKVIMITGWNEWYAGVQKTSNQEQICGGTLTPGYYMVDQMSPEYSRDGEPMRLRDGVGFGDNYYYQMVSYIRRFKGIKAPATTNGGSMDLHAADLTAQWAGVTPLFTDMVNDADLRSEISWASEFRYTNATARNDIATAQVSQDADRVYFFATTSHALITADDETWMNLYLNADGDPTTGWEGYDYLINRSRTDKTLSVERFVDRKWEFETVGTAEYALCENGLMLAVDKTLIGGRIGEAMSLTFKWADHADVRGDVMRFMELGDAAPNDRFAFAYNATSVEDERPSDETDTDTATEPVTEPATEPVTEPVTETATTTDTAENGKDQGGCASAVGVGALATLLPTAAVAIHRKSTRRKTKREEEE